MGIPASVPGLRASAGSPRIRDRPAAAPPAPWGPGGRREAEASLSRAQGAPGSPLFARS